MSAKRTTQKKQLERGRSSRRVSAGRHSDDGGNLRIGDTWNAITIIALSQNNPLKAIAEFVENSIDAGARNVTIIRGKEQKEIYLKVVDDGDGVPLDNNGNPDFAYVATHICDSIKRRLKEKGMEGIQGEYGIGLLSFWTVGERMTLCSPGNDGTVYQMELRKHDPGYSITKRKLLFTRPGAELKIRPLLSGLRQLSGDKIQNYLASELRDRIRKAGVNIRIIDRISRKELEVRPRQFEGRLLHSIGPLQTTRGEIYLELYLTSQSDGNRVGLYRSGTRVLESVTDLADFNRDPWNSGYLQGIMDVPFLQLTPGSRGGIVLDDSYDIFQEMTVTLGQRLSSIIEKERLATEEEASRSILRAVQKALREALLALPREEYGWFDISSTLGSGRASEGADQPQTAAELSGTDPVTVAENRGTDANQEEARDFFEFPGPLYSVIVSPASAIVRVGENKVFRFIARDKSRRTVDEDLNIQWHLKEGMGELSDTEKEIITYTAPGEPGLETLAVTVRQDETVCSAEAIITVTETLVEREKSGGNTAGRGLPGYTFLRSPGELWRSRFEEKNNLIVINNGHADYVFASQKKTRKLRYICRLYAKELVLRNFTGFPSHEQLERMVELMLYTEEHLR